MKNFRKQSRVLRCLGLSFAVFWYSATASADGRSEVIVDYIATPLGAVAYSVGSALEDMLVESHPWLRVRNGEGPGCSGASYNIFHDENWRKIVGCVGTPEYGYTLIGVAPFQDTSGEKFQEDVKVLFNFNNAASGLITSDPDITNASELVGERVGVGRRGQTAWGSLVPLLYKYGLPDSEGVNVEYLNPMSSHNALADRRVQAAASMVVFLPDGSESFLPPPLTELTARLDAVYPVSFDDEMIETARDAGFPVKTVTVDSELVPAFQDGREAQWIHLAFAVAVHKDFSEEIAYELTKFVLENSNRFPKYHKMLEVMATPDRALGPWGREYLHPGAIRAYQEAGVLD